MEMKLKWANVNCRSLNTKLLKEKVKTKYNSNNFDGFNFAWVEQHPVLRRCIFLFLRYKQQTEKNITAHKII